MMLRLDKSNSTPEVVVAEGTFIMEGICTPENPPRFFDKFKNELDALLEKRDPITLTFHLDYFNTGSSKCLLNLFKTVNQSVNRASVKVCWKYEQGDEEMRESGELYSEIADMDFEFIEV